MTAINALPMDQAQESLLQEQRENYRSRDADEAQYYEETAPKDINKDHDFLLHDHPLQEKPLQEEPIP